MKLLLPLNPPPLKHLAVPLLSLFLTVGCSSGSDSSNSIIDSALDVQSQSPGETATTSTEPPSVENDDNATTLNTADTTTPDGITSFPACESSATDPDGDGFGFENNVSCMVTLAIDDETPAPNETIADETIADGITTFPACESSATDPDGDGFGFENGVSCLVASVDVETPVSEEPVSDEPVSEEPVSEEPVSDETIADGITTFPSCESSATDPDGDGYGFENGVSCLVASVDAEAPASGDPDADETTAADPLSFPACESSATDPDGDGFGFENDVSCLVASTESTASDETDTDDQSGSDNMNEMDSGTGETELAASPFFEDFSAPLPSFSTQDRTTDGATVDFTFDDGFGIIRVDSTTDERERGRFNPRGRFDSFSAVMSIEPGSMAIGDGRIQAMIQSFLFNDTSEQQAGDGCFAGDVGVQVSMRLNADNTTNFVFNAFRETQSECGNTEDANVFDGMSYLVLDRAGPELGDSHRLGLAIDRGNKVLTINIDDETYTYLLETDLFQPGNFFSTFETRVDRGPGTAIVRFDEVNAGDQTLPFNDPELLGRYTFWDAGDPGTSISYPNGELRLESASDSNSRGENRMAVIGHDTRYARAQLRLSSDSVAAGGGEAMARIAGSMYYASDIPGDRSALHQVFAVTEIRLLESGATDARYCAWQSLDDSFSESISLVNPNNESGCNTFTLAPVVDQNYTVATWMDDANRRIVFSIDGEEHFHNVDGPISTGDELFEMRIQSRANGAGSRAVVFADNLESLPDAAP